jgi:hypothetical protein
MAKKMFLQRKLKIFRKYFKLIEQLTQFPLAKNDDGPVAMEMAMQTAMKPRIVIVKLRF